MKKLTNEEFIQKAKQVHQEKYDYSLVNYINSKTKVEIICPRHGSFWQAPGHHLEGSGCPECFGTPNKGLKKFSEEANKIHNNFYDYSKAVYKTARIPIEIICPIHGAFWQEPTNHLRGCGCPKCSFSKGEKKIRDFLINNGMIENKDFFSQKRFPELGNLSYDFFIPSKNILIEYNGEQHYKPIKYFGGIEKFKKQKENDLRKKEYAKENNYNLLVFSFDNDNYLDELKANIIG